MPSADPSTPPPGTPSEQGPLAGISVLDLSTVGPATRATRALADYGADVVKVAAPAHPGAEPPFHLAYHAYSASRGLRQARLNLREDTGVQAFLDLSEQVDVVMESFRPGVVDRLGVGYEAVKRRNPGIIYCATSGYGQAGPHAQRAGHDLNYLAVGGLLHTSGRDERGGPALPGATVADIAAGGLHAVVAVLAALLQRHRTGLGQYLDVAVADGVAWMASLYVDEYLATGDAPGPGHSILTGRYACYGTYQAQDGRWLAVAAIEPRFWANLCRALGLERWIDRQLDDGAQPELRRELAAAFGRHGRDHWVAELADADTCVTPVQDIADVVADPQYVEREAVVDVDHPSHGPFRQLGPVLAGAPRPGRVEAPDTAVTATDQLLREAGYPNDRIAALRDQGVIA